MQHGLMPDAAPMLLYSSPQPAAELDPAYEPVEEVPGSGDLVPQVASVALRARRRYLAPETGAVAQHHQQRLHHPHPAPIPRRAVGGGSYRRVDGGTCRTGTAAAG